MQSLEIGLKNVVSNFDRLLKDIPDMRRGLHEHLGDTLYTELCREIDSSINDSRGTIKSWQSSYVGSGGGYAAVRAVSGSGPNGHADSPGAITNYLENGHRIGIPGRNLSRRKKGYVPSSQEKRVEGRYFYRKTGTIIAGKLLIAASDYCDELADRIEGRG